MTDIPLFAIVKLQHPLHARGEAVEQSADCRITLLFQELGGGIHDTVGGVRHDEQVHLLAIDRPAAALPLRCPARQIAHDDTQPRAKVCGFLKLSQLPVSSQERLLRDILSCLVRSEDCVRRERCGAAVSADQLVIGFRTACQRCRYEIPIFNYLVSGRSRHVSVAPSAAIDTHDTATVRWST